MDSKKIALIHVIKKELGLSDDEYRDILEQATGVRSSKDLDEEKFRLLMNYFVRSKQYRVNEDGLTMKQKLYIKHLSEELGWTEAHLNNFLHKYYQKPRVNALTRKEAIKVIESLKNVKEHERQS